METTLRSDYENVSKVNGLQLPNRYHKCYLTSFKNVWIDGGLVLKIIFEILGGI